MRILSVTPYYTPEGGGLERYAHAIFSRLAARGDEVRVHAFTRNEPGTEVMDDVQVERAQAPHLLGNTPVDLGFSRRLSRTMEHWRPDVVVGHTPVPFPAHAAFFAARRAGVPFVTVYHAGRLRGSSPLLDLAARVDRATFDRWMLAGSARVVAVGPYVREHALRGLKGRTDVVPPGVDLTHFAPGADAPSNRVLFVGPLSDNYTWKGVDVLWRAFRWIHDKQPDARLVLVGDGNRREALRMQAERERLPVELPGHLTEEALLEEYRRAAVVVLPSTSEAESFGMVLAEANACGRPVVASNIGGIPDFVENEGNGLLAIPGDSEHLAVQVLRVLQDPELAHRLATRGQEKVRAEHDWDDLTDRTTDVLRSAVAEAV